MGAPIGPWSELLSIYSEMARNQHNPSDLSGNGIDPVDDISQQLQRAHPDLNKILADLDTIQGELNEMIQIAVAHHLAPPSDPKFIQLLKSTEGLVETLKNEIGTPQFNDTFNTLLTSLGDIRQDILQGMGGGNPDSNF